MSDDTPKPPGALVLDFTPVKEFDEQLQVLKEAWARVPAVARPGLSRLLWLHPNGELVVYRAPLEPVVQDDDGGS